MPEAVKKLSGSWYYLLLTLVAYSVLFIFDKSLFWQGIAFFGEIVLRVAPLFVLVFVLMTFTNYFFNQKRAIKYLTGKGSKKWLLAVVGGILSSGPIYMWYPLLKDLKEKGLTNGVAACFLYNRSIKPAILPVAVLYFGWTYVVILTLAMIMASLIQGYLINQLTNK